MISSRQKTPPVELAELLVEPPTLVGDGQIEFGARLVEDGRPAQRIWFRFPEQNASMLTRRADPFVIATAVHAQRRFSRLQVHGTVSDGLLANLAEFQAAFAAFHSLPFTEPVAYSAQETAAAAGASRRPSGITAFSGGVDSCFSVFRHTSLSSLGPKRTVAAALMMQGFDIPIEQTEVFRRSAKRSTQVTDDAGLRLFVGATNIRILPVQWEETFGAAVAGSLAFFQPAFAFGLVPSCQKWLQARFDNGSNPLTDPLLSSPSFQIIHDGTRFGRIEKLRQLAAWPAALRHMRVCWQGAELDRNCCRCEKCLRTMLMLDLCQVPASEAFPLPIDVAAIERLVIKSQGGLDEFGYLIAEARRLGLQRPWIAPTARMLKRNERSRRLWQRGQSIASFVPPGVRHALRNAGHRWLWRTPHAQSQSISKAATASLQS
jgi:hypothetical protein